MITISAKMDVCILKLAFIDWTLNADLYASKTGPSGPFLLECSLKLHMHFYGINHAGLHITSLIISQKSNSLKPP